MSNISIALAAVVVWFGLGVVFLSMCKAASRVDRDCEKRADAAAFGAPRSFRQHVFAVHARTLRSMRRVTAGRGARSVPARDHLGHHSAHSA